ncbi:2OG-Fe(II) oxygenase [Flavobacteriaceae bacterium PRS1]|nr:2OG-Fe(II) oxygenase [Flavobacteriaceae bacterium PRS1]
MSNIYLNDENKNLLEIAKNNVKPYQEAFPFPSISFDNFFSPEYLDKILEEFPDLSSIKNTTKFDNSKEIKLAGKGEKHFGNETKRFMHFLNSEPFLEFLQVLTGIKEPLIGDPYFLGGGQHEIKKGGLLKIHADFNKHEKLKLDRRINVLVYLNKNWKEEYGGHFELWDSKMEKCEKQILPTFNTLAIFSTTDFSYHGHPNVLDCPENRSRKSLALYYYSNGRPENEIFTGQEEHSTLFKSRVGNKDDEIAFKPKPKPKPKPKSTVKKIIKSLIKDLTPPIILKTVKTLANKK